MSDISPINTSTPRGVGRVSTDPTIAANRSTEDVRGRGGARANDRVEFSQVAQYLSTLQSKPEERPELIARVRDEIQNGTYLSNDKLAAAGDELLNDINLDISFGG